MNQELQQTIEAYRKGTLTPEEIEALWAQLASDPEAMQYAETLADLSELRPTEHRATITPLPTYRHWLAAAVILIAVTFVIQFFAMQGSSPAVFTLADIAITELETTPVVRSGEQLSSMEALLNEAFNDVLNGEKDKARNKYQRILSESTSPIDRSRAYFNLGVIEYNEKSFEQALLYLTDAEVLAGSTGILHLEEKVKWYLTHTFIAIDRKRDARSKAAEVYALNGSFRKAAFLLIRQLDQELGLVDFDESFDHNETSDS